MMLYISLFPRKRAVSGRGLLVMILPMVLLVSGACQPSIEVVDPRVPVATVVPSAHALAIIGVDFDPPLDSPQLGAQGGVRLLVAVENQGRYPEFDIEVSAQLRDPAMRNAGDVFLNETVVIAVLEPGEIRLVPFSQVTALPVRGRYELVVGLAAPHGELELRDSSRVYTILVNGAE